MSCFCLHLVHKNAIIAVSEKQKRCRSSSLLHHRLSKLGLDLISRTLLYYNIHDNVKTEARENNLFRSFFIKVGLFS